MNNKQYNNNLQIINIKKQENLKELIVLIENARKSFQDALSILKKQTALEKDKSKKIILLEKSNELYIDYMALLQKVELYINKTDNY